jgi:hypothetical protein
MRTRQYIYWSDSLLYAVSTFAHASVFRLSDVDLRVRATYRRVLAIAGASLHSRVALPSSAPLLISPFTSAAMNNSSNRRKQSPWHTPDHCEGICDILLAELQRHSSGTELAAEDLSVQYPLQQSMLQSLVKLPLSTTFKGVQFQQAVELLLQLTSEPSLSVKHNLFSDHNDNFRIRNEDGDVFAFDKDFDWISTLFDTCHPAPSLGSDSSFGLFLSHLHHLHQYQHLSHVSQTLTANTHTHTHTHTAMSYSLEPGTLVSTLLGKEKDEGLFSMTYDASSHPFSQAVWKKVCFLF